MRAESMRAEATITLRSLTSKGDESDSHVSASFWRDEPTGVAVSMTNRGDALAMRSAVELRTTPVA